MFMYAHCPCTVCGLGITRLACICSCTRLHKTVWDKLYSLLHTIILSENAVWNIVVHTKISTHLSYQISVPLGIQFKVYLLRQNQKFHLLERSVN